LIFIDIQFYFFRVDKNTGFALSVLEFQKKVWVQERFSYVPFCWSEIYRVEKLSSLSFKLISKLVSRLTSGNEKYCFFRLRNEYVIVVVVDIFKDLFLLKFIIKR